MQLAQIEVQYKDHMGNDLAVVNAAKVSFLKESTILGKQESRLIDYLAEHKHWTPFAHNFLKIHVKAPIFVARQLAKHQVGLVWNEVSRRYVHSEPEFFYPEGWRRKADNVKQGSSDEKLFFPSYELNIKNVLQSALDTYNALIEAGCCSEQARMILPQNMMTEWIWSGSLVAFARICELRLDSHTQRETQEVAKQISDIIKPLFPVSWAALMHDTV